MKDDLMPRYAQLVYNGFWFSPEREALQALVDKTQEYCTGERLARELRGQDGALRFCRRRTRRL